MLALDQGNPFGKSESRKYDLIKLGAYKSKIKLRIPTHLWYNVSNKNFNRTGLYDIDYIMPFL